MGVPVGVEGIEVGSRHEMARKLVAANGLETVAFVVAEFRSGRWHPDDEWATWFDSEAEAYAFISATLAPPYLVGVFAVTPVYNSLVAT